MVLGVGMFKLQFTVYETVKEYFNILKKINKSLKQIHTCQTRGPFPLYDSVLIK